MSSKPVETELSRQMRELANAGHPRADELRAKADEFDIKSAASLQEPVTEQKTKSMLGAWARARRLWSECTEHDLI